MKTPITDAASLNTDAFVSPAKAREFARRLELDRAALIEALELCRSTLGGLHASFSTPEEWQSLWPTIKAAKSTLATARANFPTP